jgi:hypothetical protein
VRILAEADDALPRIDKVQSLTVGLLQTYAPQSLILIKVDNFFSLRWLRFSGKALGAVGIWKKQLTIPPFVPNRIVSQQSFVGRNFDEPAPSKAIHIQTRSMKALQRYTADVVDGAMVVWYSGQSNDSTQAAMMAHIPTPDGYWPIYVRWVQRESSWRVIETLEINSTDVERLSRIQTARESDAAANGVPRV